MYKLFTWGRIAYVGMLVLWGASLVLCFAHVLPGAVMYISFIVTLAAELGINILSAKLYQNMLNRADSDIDGFVREQDCLAAKQKGKMKQIVSANIIVALLEYDRLDEVRRRLQALSQMIQPNDFPARFQYSSILMTLDIKCRNFSGIDFYVNDMKMCLTNIGPMNGVSAKAKQRWQFLIEMNLIEAEFYSRTPQALATTDFQIAQRYLADLEHYRILNKENKIFIGAQTVRDLFERGTVYAVLGDLNSANALLSQTASLPYTYPCVSYAKQYLQTGDINILFRA